MRDRIVMVPAFLIVAGIYAWHWVWLLWAHLLAPGEYVSVFEWLDQGMLLMWVLLFALSLILGFLAVTLVRPTKPLTVGMVFGALLGLALVHGTHYGFTQYSTMWTYWWDYGLYLVAPIGSTAGAALSVPMQRWLRTRLLSNNRWSGP
jgi:hypothetical protein